MEMAAREEFLVRSRRWLKDLQENYLPEDAHDGKPLHLRSWCQPSRRVRLLPVRFAKILLEMSQMRCQRSCFLADALLTALD
jgi:hypothetical protein